MTHVVRLYVNLITECYPQMKYPLSTACFLCGNGENYAKKPI